MHFIDLQSRLSQINKVHIVLWIVFGFFWLSRQTNAKTVWQFLQMPSLFYGRYIL